MLKIKKIVASSLILTSLLFSGCAYINVSVPLDVNLDNTSLGSKEGEAYNQSVLWAFAWGDAGTKAAAENGNISVITHADRKVYAVFFGIYTKTTTVVYGD